MLGSKRAAATLAVSDLQRARDFYENTLGLEPLQEVPESLRHKSGNSMLLATGGATMRRCIALVALLATLSLAVTQTAAADPVNAKNAGFFTATCSGETVMVVVNGNGVFTPAHVLGSTSVFVPTAFDLTFTFTPTEGAPEIDTATSAKAHQPSNSVTCELPTALNTVTFPEGTFTVSGTVTGFFTPAR
jgi:catechol 2,3-dioxygenase-like lactoylglutathione lyase family enzyme